MNKLSNKSHFKQQNIFYEFQYLQYVDHVYPQYRKGSAFYRKNGY